MQGRHEAIQKIEQDFIELARLYEELNQQVVVQEAQVVQINEGAERVQEHITQANTQLDGAVVKARARNRKKWWCVGIVGQFSPSSIPVGGAHVLQLPSFWSLSSSSSFSSSLPRPSREAGASKPNVRNRSLRHRAYREHCQKSGVLRDIKLTGSASIFLPDFEAGPAFLWSGSIFPVRAQRF